MAKHRFGGAPIDFEKGEALNMRLQNLFQFPIDPFEGQVIYRTDLKVGALYTGTAWLLFGLTEEILEALQSANAPDGANPFATIDDIPIVPEDFIDLLDTPNAYTGEGGKVVAVKSTEDGVEFIVLVGVPSGGAAGQILGKLSAADFAIGWVDQTDGGYEDYVPSSGNILFDIPRSYGYNGTVVTGNLNIDTTDAKEINMAKVLHQAATAPNISVTGGGVTLHLSGGTYDPAKVNEILFICHKNNLGVVTRISYSINPNQL